MPSALSLSAVLAVAAGGAIGSVLRYLVGLLAPHAPTGAVFPWSTLGVNIAGSLLLGALAGAFIDGGSPQPALRLFLTVGLLGGFTTFSTFALDAVTVALSGHVLRAVVYVSASVVGAIGAAALGFMVVRG